MNRNIEIIAAALEDYHPSDFSEYQMVEETRQFVRSSVNSLDRANPAGHVTASAWLLNSKHNAVLLTHHRKLGRWMQLGGHIENGESVFEAAIREATEESGIKAIRPLSNCIYDVDVHAIPTIKGVLAHLHYDIRFLMETTGQPICSEESNELAWIPLSEIADYCQEESVLRLVRKTPPSTEG